jgi:hypothetical protein
MQERMPGWKFRMYYDDTAPKEIVKSLEAMPNTELIEKPIGKGREGCFWRFEAWDDCEIAVCRDLDFRVQENDLISIDEWLKTNHQVHCIQIVHNRRKMLADYPGRCFLAGGISARNLPFSVAKLLKEYSGDKSCLGEDEVFLTRCFIPEVYKYQKKVLFHVEPRCKGSVELFPEREDYVYLKKNWVGI